MFRSLSKVQGASDDRSRRSAYPNSTHQILETLQAAASRRNSEIFLLRPTEPHAALSEQPFASSDIVVDVSEFVYRYRRIDRSRSIDIVLLGQGLDLGSVTQIGRILRGHQGKVTAVVPGPVLGPVALLVLAADEVIMPEDAWVALGSSFIRDLERVAARKGFRHLDDLSVLALHIAALEKRETAMLACELLHGGQHQGACAIAKKISAAAYDDKHPARAKDLRRIGVRVRTTQFFDTIEVSKEPAFSIAVLSNAASDSSSAVRVLPTCAEACPVGDAQGAMSALQSKRNSRVISIVHDRGTSEEMVTAQTAAEALKAIRGTPADKNIDMILHTPGGMTIFGEQIARALKAHKGRKSVFVPYSACSAGTIIALAADEIFLAPHATLGPIDTQLRLAERLYVPAAALASLPRRKPARKIEDRVLLRAVSAGADVRAGRKRATELMRGAYSWWTRRKIARYLNDGHLTHAYPVMYAEAKKIGLKVKLDMPDEVYTIVDDFIFEDGEFCDVIHCSGLAAAETA